jgi:putative nucleotidyltransferase with HDIG domain
LSSRSREIASQTFSSQGWKDAVRALFQATGVTVNAMDFSVGDALSSAVRCSFCSFAGAEEAPSPRACFGECSAPGPDISRVVCRSGLPTLIAPIEVERELAGYLVLGGFVTSTRERRRLYEQLISRNATEDSARMALKSLALVPRRQAEGYLQIALASARAMLDATFQRRASSDRVEELKLFVSAGQHVVETESLDAVTLGAITEEAVALMGGEAGAVLRQGGNLLEVVARTELWRGQVGALVPKEGTASGRAITTGRTVVSSGASSPTKSASLALPLTIGERVLGVLEVRLPASALPVSPERVARLDRFGRFIAIALERDDERAQIEHAAMGYAQLNQLAATLGGQTDMEGVAKIVTTVLDKAFTYDIAGLILTSYGRDHADVVVCGEVTRGELDLVLGEAAGRDAVAEPFETLRTATHRGLVTEGGTDRQDWATVVVELSHGDLELGYLLLARADGARYNTQDRLLLEGIAAHAGAAFGRAALFGRIRDDYAKTIAALSATLDAGERMPSGHSNRVMGYAMMIGEELGLGYEDVEQLRFAGLLHDIGKTGLPGEILLKPSRLSADELAQVHSHAEIGASIVDQIEFLKSLTPVILHHHEHWDGSGYPIGLSGEDIPLMARILCVADSFDAMTTKSSYKKRMPFATARLELEANVGTHFDPRVVAALLEALDKQALAGVTGLLVAPEAGARTDLPA